MIYFFDQDGRCIRRASNVNDEGKDKREIALHMLAINDPNVVYVVSDVDYRINDIYLAPGRRITPRVEIPFSFNPSTQIISGLPIPTTIDIDSSSYVVSDGSAELALSYPGVYVVTMRAWPYLDTNLKVSV